MSIIDRMPEFLRKLLWPDAVGGSAVGASEPPWVVAYNTMQSRYSEYHRYYSGSVLHEPVDPKKKDSGLKYPLKLNMVRSWSHMKASYVYGEWKDSVVTFVIQKRKRGEGVSGAEERRVQAMEDFLREQWRMQQNDSMADAAAIDMMVYGGTVAKVYWDNIDKKIRTDWLPPQVFCPRWHPTDVNRLMAVYIMYEMSREDIEYLYGVSIKGMPPMVEYVEEWTDEKLKITVHGDVVVRDEDNPLGFIPHIYIPRIRTPDNFGYYGLSLIEDTMAIQNEINSRAADIGDGVAYSSHPIRYVINYTGKEKLEVGPDSLWDLGMQMGTRKPEAGTLDAKGNYQGAMDYVKDIQSFGRTSVSLPPIAFGEDEGSQRSSLTLLVRYQPLMQEVRRERLQLARGLEDWAKKTLTIGVKNGLVPGIDQSIVDSAIIDAKFAPVMPQSVEDIVNRWNIRIAGGFGTPEEAYTELGHSDPSQAAKDAFAYQKKVSKLNREASNAGNNDGQRGEVKPGGDSASGGKTGQNNLKANATRQGESES